MKRFAMLSTFLAVIATGSLALESQALGLRSQSTVQVQLNGHGFTLPAGFEIELVAGPPLVDRPIVADFDEQGRLYVADSSGSNDNVDEQLKKKPHRILRLEASKGDGRFDRRTIFADKMMFPEGTMWYAGSLYVSAPPSIWKLTDTHGDGVADQRMEWLKKTLTRCANDLHGPYLGPDGWIYWCKGAFAKQTYERPGKQPFVTSAAHIFRCRPDGTGIEPVMTGGMDNPVDVVFTPEGERIFTTTFLQHPGGGHRDGLIHAIYGGVYGKDHEPIYQHPWTGPDLMPVLSHFGAAAPCGLVRYESRVFGPEYQDNLFACQFNMHKVSRHVLEPSGATFVSHDEDFLVSNNLDFHPTDILEDADGSLLVIDTGGWYKLCCPTSQLHKPDVLGAIYRVRRKGAPQVEDPRGLKLPWSKMSAQQLSKLLGDQRPAVRHRAIEALAEKGTSAIPALKGVLSSEGSSTEAKRNAVWAATRVKGSEARELVRGALEQMDSIDIKIKLGKRTETRASVRKAITSEDFSVQQVAIHSISVWRDSEALNSLLSTLQFQIGHQKLNNACRTEILRATAEALGRIGDKAAVPHLLAALENPVDRVLDHSLTYALIEIGDREGTMAGLKSTNMHVRRAALIAVDQMNGGKLEVASVAKELDSTDPRMKETAWWIASRHPEWGGALAGYLRDRLAAKSLTASEREDLTRQLARFAKTTTIQELLAERLRDGKSTLEARRVALQAMAKAGLKETPSTWIAALTECLEGSNRELVQEAVLTARAFPVPKKRPDALAAALLKVGNNTSASANVRLTALAAVPGGLTSVEPPIFAFVRTHLDREQPVADRALAADVFAHAKLNAEQLVTLAECLKTVGPMEIDRILEAFAQSTEDRVGQNLVQALNASSARAALSVGMLKPRLAKFGAPVQRQAQELYAALEVDTSKQKARLEQLMTSLHGGDVRRGQLVFQGTKGACSSCHAIGYLGGNVGPDLTRIGGIRSDRDLLEAIVFPSASFVRSYEPVLVATKDGKFHNGLIRKETADEIVLATGANQEVRIARTDIEDIQPSKVSVMPSGLDQQLTQRELADLVAFLKACK